MFTERRILMSGKKVSKNITPMAAVRAKKKLLAKMGKKKGK